MNKRVILLLLVSFLIPIVSGELLITQPKVIYNAGDELALDITLKPIAATTDTLIADLLCENTSVQIFMNSFKLAPNEERRVPITYFFAPPEFSGENCFIRARYGGEEVSTSRFSISKEVLVTANIVKHIYEPGEKVVITGTAMKPNGLAAEGFIEASVGGNVMKGVVTNGSFTLSFNLPTNESGSRTIDIHVYEKDDSGNIINEGTASLTLEIRQILTTMEIQMNNVNITPGDNLDYSIVLEDQAGLPMHGEIAISLLKPDDSLAESIIVTSDDGHSFSFATNATAGYWKLMATIGEISQKRILYVAEKEQVTFTMENNTLTIANIGNVRYQKPVEINIGSSKQIKQIDLDIGEMKQYRLSAPQGSYLIGVGDGERAFSFGSVALTGNAIEIGEVQGSVGDFFKNTMFLWIFLVGIAAVAAAIYFIRKRNNNTVVSKPVPGYIRVTPSTLGDDNKEEAVVVALRASGDEGAIDEAINKARKQGVLHHFDGRHHLLVFTKRVKSDIASTAISYAKDVASFFGEHNTKFAKKVTFGIGLSDGQVITEMRGGKTHFDSIGSLVSVAKKAAEKSRGEIIASDSLHRRLINVAQFSQIDGSQLWKLERVADREKHQEFLKGFVERYDKK